MNLLDLAVRITCDDQASGAIEQLSTGAMAKAVVVGNAVYDIVKATAKAAVDLGKEALGSYADYEQLVGGVQKLFGNMNMTLDDYAASVGKTVDEVSDAWNRNQQAQETVLANARQAFKTANLSENEYMQTATSFSAALISSLSGDTQRAAEVTDVAMQDMADNVNTFGSSMEDVQNAYMGFSKQNYTMLDNLKLGYGGTKSEMERLIKDANALRAAQGENADLTIDSFADIVTAIHEVQKAQNIAGTTSREAATTIEGSVNTAKAAWTNWVAALANDNADIASYTSDLVDSVVTAAGNIVPRLSVIASTLVSQVPSLVGQLGPKLAVALGDTVGAAIDTTVAAVSGKLSAALPNFKSLFEGIVAAWETGDNPFESFANACTYAIDQVSRYVPRLGPLVEQGMQAVVDGIGEGAATVAELAGRIVPMLADGITTGLPLVVGAISELVGSLGQYLSDNGGQIIESGLQLLQQLSQSLLDNSHTLVDAAMQLVLGLAQGLVDGLPALIEYVPQIVSNIANIINDNAPTILMTGIEVIGTLAMGLIQAIPTLVENIPAIIQALVDVWSAFSWVDLGKNALTAIGDGITALLGNLQAAGQNIVQAITNAVLNLPSTLSTLASNAMSAMSGGISGMLSAVGSAAAGIFNTVINAFTSLPGRMLEIGTNVITGLVNGIKNAASSVVGAISGVVGDAIQGAKNLLGIHSPSRVFREIGDYTMRGMQLGIEDAAGLPVQAAREAMEAVAGLGPVNVAANVSQQAGVGDAVTAWLADNLPGIIAEYTPYVGQRDFDRMARKAVAYA